MYSSWMTYKDSMRQQVLSVFVDASQDYYSDVVRTATNKTNKSAIF